MSIFTKQTYHIRLSIVSETVGEMRVCLTNITSWHISEHRFFMIPYTVSGSQSQTENFIDTVLLSCLLLTVAYSAWSGEKSKHSVHMKG